jgi:hypothetical protein
VGLLGGGKEPYAGMKSASLTMAYYFLDELPNFIESTLESDAASAR